MIRAKDHSNNKVYGSKYAKVNTKEKMSYNED